MVLILCKLCFVDCLLESCYVCQLSIHKHIHEWKAGTWVKIRTFFKSRVFAFYNFMNKKLVLRSCLGLFVIVWIRLFDLFLSIYLRQHILRAHCAPTHGAFGIVYQGSHSHTQVLSLPRDNHHLRQTSVRRNRIFYW